MNVLSLYFPSSIGNTLLGSCLSVVCGWFPGFYSVGLRPTERIHFEKKYSSRIKGAPWQHDGVRARERSVGSKDREPLDFAPWKNSTSMAGPWSHWPHPIAGRLECRPRATSLIHEFCTWNKHGSSRIVDCESWSLDDWAVTNVDQQPRSRRVSRYFRCGCEIPLELDTTSKERKHQKWQEGFLANFRKICALNTSISSSR